MGDFELPKGPQHYNTLWLRFESGSPIGWIVWDPEELDTPFEKFVRYQRIDSTKAIRLDLERRLTEKYTDAEVQINHEDIVVVLHPWVGALIIERLGPDCWGIAQLTEGQIYLKPTEIHRQFPLERIFEMIA